MTGGKFKVCNMCNVPIYTKCPKFAPDHVPILPTYAPTLLSRCVLCFYSMNCIIIYVNDVGKVKDG